ncbi:11-beta-hydroxysteroid dehydrogenase 1B [Glycine soja]
MDLIHKFLNIVAPITTFFFLCLFLPPYWTFKFFLSIINSIFSENVAGKVVHITGASSVPPLGLVLLLLMLPPYLLFKILRFIVRSIFSENVAGKVILITGASSGIGEHLAYEYGRRGARLALVARRENRLKEVASIAKLFGSPEVIIIPADVSSSQDCKRFVDSTINHFGQLDHLVNNAGVSAPGLFESTTDIRNFAPAMDINFWGSAYGTYFAIPHLRKSKGKIIAIASCTGWLPVPRMSIYNASKAAVISLYETLRIELGRDIGITIVTPGLIESEMSQGKVLFKEGKMVSDQLIRDKPQVEDQQDLAEDSHTEQEDNSEMKEIDGKGEEEKEKEEEVEGDEENEEKEERDELKSKKSTKESAFATPGSERPTRERKTVERYTVSSPDKFPRSSSIKALSIEKGSGTQLMDIPNVAFTLSKRKADDNLRALHSILFGKKAKAHHLKRNIGLFSGYVWTENEEKQRAKIREKIDKCVKEKLVDFCNVLNIPITKTSMKKEELSAKLLEFLESPHATTDVLLADKEKKGKKRARKQTPSKSPAKKQKQNSQVGKKQKQSSDIEDSDAAEPSDAKVDSREDDDSSQKSEGGNKESISEKEEDKEKVHKRTSKKILKEDQTTPVKKTTGVKTAKSNENTSKKSTSKRAVTDSTSKSKKQKSVKENLNSKRKDANKKQTGKSLKALLKDQGKDKSSEKAKAEPSKEELHRVAVDILKEVDFNKATLSDILRQLGTHFDVDLMPRKAEVKDIITDVINNMSDDDREEAENVGDDDADEDDA